MATGHLLTIGCTGMLAPALRSLSPGYAHTTVIARTASLFQLDGALRVDADWGETQSFVGGAERAITEHGPPNVVLAWVHRDGEDALRSVMRLLHNGTLVVRVLGSSTGDPRERDAEWRSWAPDGVRCASVVLGRVRTGDGWRWLTHEEISAAAVEAVRTERDAFAGTLG